MKRLGRKILATGALAVSLILAGCGQDQAESTHQTVITVGTTPGMFADMVRDSVRPQLEEKGYTVKLIEFNDYVRPNMALADGDLDINIFQHKPYLDVFKGQRHLDLVEVFQVPTAPLGIYPGKLKSLADLKEGARISVPNDPSNFARALVMLDELGWIKLKAGVNPILATKNDISENLKGIEIVELDAAQVPRSRSDVDFAIINGNYAIDAKIPLTDALFQEPSFAYVNWSAVKSKDIGAPWLKDVADAYNSEAFKAYIAKTYPGFKLPAAWGNQP
ncbi:hypothetical protein J7624_09225 [Wohlfahrtiimonas chitiniclastica]|uniref:MetQ/NlpA family ABC transporter substrate-binding protein n=1 Tax=Wohlfahrtiimonas chitiniclastica TaxID=400946 RepID=UPI001BCB1447|nr:MetQ/NlpA family ABC transporter substrate-binding protein [Wohlfahrtiimonas chitiniclastica]MBS7819546.1 hypothetical protein [Wohlfahrtiimonas chitiniclastica]MBS7827321.1 hypothetical protein [Wohlfahrtiimonas chitiniclastica]